MKRRFSLLLLYLLALSSCSDKYYKSAKNPHTVIYRGQRTVVETHKPSHSELAQRTKALLEAKVNQKDFMEDDFHEIPPAKQVTTAVTQKYIEDYKDIAMVEMQRYNIPASITLAQGILESGSGQGRLARYGNNHFGIKCHATWNGKTITHDDDEKSECFRRYKYAYESFEDHSQFLMKRGRYSSLFELNPTDYEGWAHGLKKAGYATDPTYARKLIALIKKFNLHQYDNQVIAMKGTTIEMPMGSDIISTPVPKKEVAPVAENNSEPVKDNTKVTSVTKRETPRKVVKKEAPKPVEVAKKETSEPVEVPKKAEEVQPAPAKVDSIKKEAVAEYYKVQTGDTLYKIAREQQVSVQQLMKLNNLDDISSSTLRVGQQIRLN